MKKFIRRIYDKICFKEDSSYGFVYAYYDLFHKLHRTNGPAAINNDGTEIWYYHGKLHRSMGPAITIGTHPSFDLIPTYIFYNFAENFLYFPVGMKAYYNNGILLAYEYPSSEKIFLYKKKII